MKGNTKRARNRGESIDESEKRGGERIEIGKKMEGKKCMLQSSSALVLASSTNFDRGRFPILSRVKGIVDFGDDENGR